MSEMNKDWTDQARRAAIHALKGNRESTNLIRHSRSRAETDIASALHHPGPALAPLAEHPPRQFVNIFSILLDKLKEQGASERELREIKTEFEKIAEAIVSVRPKLQRLLGSLDGKGIEIVREIFTTLRREVAQLEELAPEPEDDFAILKELEAAGVPEYPDQRKIPKAERVDPEDFYWEHYRDFHGRVYQFHLEKWDRRLIGALRHKYSKMKKPLSALIPTKSDFLNKRIEDGLRDERTSAVLATRARRTDSD